MSDLNNKDTILAVIDEIMTDMFFIFPDLDDDGMHVTEGKHESSSIHVRIHFHTDFYLHFQIDESLLAEMAINFMGIPSNELQREHIESMACEAANIIGGNYLVRVDPDAKHKLSIPEIVSADELNSNNEIENHWKLTFVAEERMLTITPLKKTD